MDRTPACKRQGPTISSTRVQFFNLNSVGAALRCTTNTPWTTDPGATFADWQGVVLCRERVGSEYFRYFLGQVKRARLVAEAPAPRDSARVQFGLAALAGKPITIAVTSSDSESIFHVPIHLPRAERQLALALGECNVSSRSRAYRVRGHAFVCLIAASLRNLGCELRHARV